jgi:hypothetical protein
MTKQAMALVLFTAGTAAYAGQPEQKLTVYVQNTAGVPCTVLVPAEALAGKMFAGIGISLVWRHGKPAGESSQPPIFVELVTGTPESLKPGALAFALPYEGSHLTVFYDRITANQYPGSMLAHVMVHEITHLLQGIDRHSSTGVMKANWTKKDFGVMRMGTLPFAPEDVVLINAGMTARARVAAAAAPAATR